MLLSIIIPLYNAENTLCEVVNSILATRSKEFELILVDDGSQDGTYHLCNGYEQRDSRCHVVHRDNGGVSCARNAGLAIATGKYVFFCDADDFVNTEVLHKIILLLKSGTEDVFIADFMYRIKDETQVSFRYVKSCFKLPECRELSKGEIQTYLIAPLILFTGTDIPPLWNKVFKRDVIVDNGILFENNVNKGEDWRFVLDFLLKAKSAYYFPYVLYQYRIDGSQSDSKYKKIPGRHLLGTIRRKMEVTDALTLNVDRKILMSWYYSQIEAVVFSARAHLPHKELKQMINDSTVQKAAKELLNTTKSEYIYFEISRKYWIYALLVKLKLKNMLGLVGRCCEK